MHQHLLAVPAHDLADWLHRRVAVALAIAWMGVVNMATPQAVRTMIPMSATGDRSTDELLAMHAFERLVAFISWRMTDTILLFAGVTAAFGELLSPRLVDLVICE